MILKILVNIQMIFKMFINILKNRIYVKRIKILILFDDMIADMINNKKLNPVVTELFIAVRKLNILIVFITKSYFKVPKYVRLNFIHFFIIKIPNNRELIQIPLNHSSDIDFEDFEDLQKMYGRTIFFFS